MNERERGMSLAEVLVALAVLSTVVVFSGNLLTAAYRRTQDNTSRQFAVQKAMSMLEELKALIQNEATSAVLDSYDDGTVNQPILTTQAGVTDPAAHASGNRNVSGRWLFERRITVQKVPGSNDLRLVNVKVFVNDAGGTRLLAEVASVLTTFGQNAPPTQVYDIYLIAIENVPGWWVYMQNVVPFVENAMQDLESRHAGLQFRRHWIRKLSYGRDPYYTPDVNAKVESTEPIDSVYFYPGLLPAGSPVTYYYPPDFFSGRVRVDGVIKNGFDATANPFPYSLADQYDTGMRYQDEKDLFDLRVAAGLESAGSPTLRLLLDDMYANPAKYTNAILINLHGELLPFPPLRNYSDPAKDPAKYPGVRVVTHPERLRYGSGDAVNLRVYAYHTNTVDPATVPDWMGKGGTATPITVVLKNVTWTPGSAYVTAITGGVDFSGDGKADSYAAGAATTTASPVSAPTQMWWTSQTAGSDTVIKLYNTPLKAPCVKVKKVCDGGGLDDALRLYDMQYIPSPVENLPDATSPLAFTTNLANKDAIAKNTARWVISIPSTVLPATGVLTYETRIGNDFSGGVSSPPLDAKSNLSRTYVYRGDDAWAFGDSTNPPNLPLTERFQFMGDPRHCPYADLKMPHGTSGLARANALGMGYNRYFDDFDMAGDDRDADWPGWSYQAPALTGGWYGIKNNGSDSANNNDGWEGGGSLEVDVPRMFQVLRSSILRSHAVYTTMTGFSYYYLGLGNEIGYDTANGFPESILLSEKPFNGGSGKRNEQSITNEVIKGATGGVKVIAENTTGWWGMSWLGELYPDSAYATWKTSGNLPSGSASGTFVRVLRESVATHLPAGTSFVASVRRTGPPGSTAFFWSGTADATFHHAPADNTEGALDADGTVVSQTYKLPLPSTVSNNRPFDIAIKDTGANPNHFLQPVYGAATSLGTEARFYKHQNNIQGSSLLSMRDANANTAFVVVNGLSPVGESGVAFIARWSFLSLVQSFFSAGLTQVSGVPDPARVRELPRVEITSPDDSMEIDDPANLTVTWEVTWRRWDGIRYTPSYAETFSEDTPVKYALLYSRDNGKSWRYMKDETVTCRAGERPADALLESGTSYTWSVPSSSFPKGNYLIRVEAYRDTVALHYAFHQYRAFIKRP
ncbi:MAG: prepilin-type N-terminal cleavage/methylation domain-containing protein [Thermoanaerobaculia bacterium]